MRFLLAFLLIVSAAHAQSVDLGGHAIASWGYQLQGRNGKPIDLSTVAAIPADLVVIDYSATGDVDGEFTAQQIATLKASGKIVLAYLSIGEAETYRFYWDQSWINQNGTLTANAPAFLAAENPGWHGNYKVRYWLPEWQSLIFGTATGAQKSYVDRVIDAGFDGVYLDIIDGFEYFGPDNPKHFERPTAAADMASFVEGISQYARSTRGKTGFLLVPQNGANILDEITESQGAAYLAAIDAIGAEDTFFYGSKAMNNAYHPQKYVLGFLDQFTEAGKPVLAVEYVNQKAKARRFKKVALDHGFLPLISTRNLDRFLPQP